LQQSWSTEQARSSHAPVGGEGGASSAGGGAGALSSLGGGVTSVVLGDSGSGVDEPYEHDAIKPNDVTTATRSNLMNVIWSSSVRRTRDMTLD
jgi:hypothetical protein